MTLKQKRRLRGAVVSVCLIAVLAVAVLLVKNKMFALGGSCGVEGAENSVVWQVDTRGTLTISGDGEMMDDFPYQMIFVYQSRFHTSVDFAGSIRRIVVEDGVKNVGENAFAGLENVKSITLPGSVRRIGGRAFSGLRKVESITIPASTVEIGTEAFAGCYGLKEIAVEAGNPNYTAEDGVLMDREKTALLAYPCGRGAEEYTVPGYIENIGDSAFCCADLRRVELPDTVKRIGKNAFDNCAALESARLPEGLAELSEYAFVNCISLKEIVLPDSVTKFGNGVFMGCKALSSVKLPAGLETVSGMTFKECSALKRIDLPAGIGTVATEAFAACGIEELALPEGLTTIGARAFSGCGSLKKITVPASVAKIGSGAFAGCVSLAEIDYAGTEELWQKATGGEDVGFDKY